MNEQYGQGGITPESVEEVLSQEGATSAGGGALPPVAPGPSRDEILAEEAKIRTGEDDLVEPDWIEKYKSMDEGGRAAILAHRKAVRAKESEAYRQSQRSRIMDAIARNQTMITRAANAVRNGQGVFPTSVSVDTPRPVVRAGPMQGPGKVSRKAIVVGPHGAVDLMAYGDSPDGPQTADEALQWGRDTFDPSGWARNKAFASQLATKNEGLAPADQFKITGYDRSGRPMVTTDAREAKRKADEEARAAEQKAVQEEAVKRSEVQRTEAMRQQKMQASRQYYFDHGLSPESAFLISVYENPGPDGISEGIFPKFAEEGDAETFVNYLKAGYSADKAFDAVVKAAHSRREGQLSREASEKRTHDTIAAANARSAASREQAAQQFAERMALYRERIEAQNKDKETQARIEAEHSATFNRQASDFTKLAENYSPEDVKILPGLDLYSQKRVAVKHLREKYPDFFAEAEKQGGFKEGSSSAPNGYYAPHLSAVLSCVEEAYYNDMSRYNRLIDILLYTGYLDISNDIKNPRIGIPGRTLPGSASPVFVYDSDKRKLFITTAAKANSLPEGPVMRLEFINRGTASPVPPEIIQLAKFIYRWE